MNGTIELKPTVTWATGDADEIVGLSPIKMDEGELGMNLELLLTPPELETFLRKMKESLEKNETIQDSRVRELYAITLGVMAIVDDDDAEKREHLNRERMLRHAAIVKRVLTDGKDLPPAVADVVLTAALPEQGFQ